MNAKVGILTLDLALPGCRSLKEKRSVIKPLLAKMMAKFRVSASEVYYQDNWQRTEIVCAFVSSNAKITNKALHSIIEWIETSKFQVHCMDENIEIL